MDDGIEEFKSNRTSEDLIPEKTDASRTDRPNPSLKVIELEKQMVKGRNTHFKQLSEIPKTNRQSDKIISEIELNDAEEFVMSDPDRNPITSPKDGERNTREHEEIHDTPQMNYTSGDQNNTRIEAVKRSTMIGVNLFGRSKQVEKKVNFESQTEEEKSFTTKEGRHYNGNFQSQYRKKQFVENPGSDDDFSRQAEDDEFFDYRTNSERKDEDNISNPFGFESTYSVSPMKKSFNPFDKSFKDKSKVAKIQHLNLNFVHSYCNRNVNAYQKYKTELEKFLNDNEDGEMDDYDDPDGYNRKLGKHLQQIISNEDEGAVRNQFIRKKLRKLLNEAFKTSILMSRPFTTENLLYQAETYFIQPKITQRELYPLIMDKQYNLVTQLINKNVILKKQRHLQLQEKILLGIDVMLRTPKSDEPEREDESQSDSSINHQDMKKKYRTKEKYLRVSDFVQFIMENKNLYSTSQNPESVFKQTIKFLRGMQYKVDFDKCAHLLLLNNYHQMLMTELEKDSRKEESTGEDLKMSFKSSKVTLTPVAKPNANAVANDSSLNPLEKALEGQQTELQKHNSEDRGLQINYFTWQNRVSFIVAMLEQATQLKFYDIACEIMKQYKNQILRFKNLKIFDNLFQQFENDPSKYEAKIYLLGLLMPCMSRRQGIQILKILEKVIDEPYEKSLFYRNINPIRVGLMLYKLVDDLQQKLQTSDGVIISIKTKIKERLHAIMEVYKDSEKVIPMFEQTDFEGQNCYWYLVNYEMSEVLNCSILEQTIEEKWNGRVQVNSSIIEYSSPYQLYTDNIKQFTGDQMIQNFKQIIFDKNKEMMTHIGQYHVWKRSMRFRFYLEVIYTMVMTILFQYYISDFNRRLHLGTDDLKQLDSLKKSGADYSNQKQLFLADVDYMITDFNCIFYLTIPYALFPVHLLGRIFFEVRTKRFDSSKLTPIHYCELGCFILLILWELEKQRLRGREPIDVDQGEGYTSDQQLILEIIREVMRFKIYFQFLLSSIALLTWLKFQLMFRVTKQFGPLFKMIYKMTLELMKFLVFWFVMILIFSCVAMLIFSHIENFHNIKDTFFYFLQAALGSYDFDTFDMSSVLDGDDDEIKINNAKRLSSFGEIYLVLYLFVNMILMLNMVIAILAEVFTRFNEQQTGLYQTILLEMMPSMEFDHRYGVILQSTQPFNILLIPIYWMVIFFEHKYEHLKWFNDLMCRITYLPVAILMTLCMCVFNIVLLPLVYVYHSSVLFKRIFRTTSLRKAIKKAFIFTQFITVGLLLLMVSIIVDPFQFMVLLYFQTDDQYLDLLKILQDDIISMRALNLFEQTCDLLLNYSKLSKGIQSELDQYNIERTSIPLIKYSSFNKILQKEFQIQKRTRELLYGHKYEPLATILNGKHTINPRIIRRLKEYDAFKKFVVNQSDQSTDMVDINQIKGFIDEIDLRYNIIKTNLEKGDIIFSGGITMQDIFYGALKELNLTNRYELQLCFQNQDEEIQGVAENVNSIGKAIAEIKAMLTNNNKSDTPTPKIKIN